VRNPSSLFVFAIALLPGTVLAGELMGVQSQWSVSYVSGSGDYCDLAWDSDLGRKADFQASRDAVTWTLTNDAWKLSGTGGGRVKVVGGDRSWKLNGKAQSATSMSLSDGTDNAASIREILAVAVTGGSDIQLTFPGTEPDWTVPVSRLYSMRSTIEKCMARLKSKSADKPDGATTSTPF
jgi:hypothetical protein